MVASTYDLPVNSKGQGKLPPWWAWIAGAAGVASLACLVLLAELPLIEIEKALRAGNVAQAVQQHRYADARLSAQGLFEDFWSVDLVSSIDGLAHFFWSVDDDLPRCIDVLEALGTRDLARLQEKLGGGVVRRARWAGDDDVARFRTILQQQTDTVQQLDEIAAARVRLAPEYRATQSTLEVFLGLGERGETAPLTGDRAAFLFYSTGPLAALPKLAALPGEYADLPQLRHELDALNATVKVTGPNPMQDFLDTLAELRARSSNVRGALESLAARETSLRLLQGNLLSELDALLPKTRKAFQAHIELMLTPPSFFERVNSWISGENV